MPDLIIKVDFFKPSGKWYNGGNVNIGNARLWKGDIPQAIVNNQTIISDGWQDTNYYTVVVQDLSENMAKVEYKEFCTALFSPSKFFGLKRGEVICS